MIFTLFFSSGPFNNSIVSATMCSNGIFSGGLIMRPIRESSSRSFNSACILSTAFATRSISFSKRVMSLDSASWRKYPKKPRIVTRGDRRSCDTVYANCSNSAFCTSRSAIKCTRSVKRRQAGRIGSSLPRSLHRA